MPGPAVRGVAGVVEAGEVEEAVGQSRQVPAVREVGVGRVSHVTDVTVSSTGRGQYEYSATTSRWVRSRCQLGNP